MGKSIPSFHMPSLMEEKEWKEFRTIEGNFIKVELILVV